MKPYDVAIVGGGVIGASIAFELASGGLRVILLDRQLPGQESSWAAAGMLSPTPHSPKDAPLVPLARRSLQLYPEFVASIEEASGLSVHYAPQGTLHIFVAPQGELERGRLVGEHSRLGLAAQSISLDAARELEPHIGPSARAAAWLPGEATVEPRPLMDALLAASRNRGVEIRPGCRVTSLLSAGGRCAGLATTTADIAAAHVVLAAGCFSAEIEDTTGVIARYVPTRPVRGQILALRSNQVTLQRVVRSERGYLVPRTSGVIVAGSTLEEAGFDKAVTPDGKRQILGAALELAPALNGADIVDAWSGLRPGTPDDLPILGPAEMEGLLVATGHYRNGILLAPVTAKLIYGWIAGKHSNLDTAAFSPLRFSQSVTGAQRAMHQGNWRRGS